MYYKSKPQTMTTIETLNKRISEILNSRYKVINRDNKLEVRFSGYKIAFSHLLSEIENKAGEQVKKEIAKTCLMLTFAK